MPDPKHRNSHKILKRPENEYNLSRLKAFPTYLSCKKESETEAAAKRAAAFFS